MIASVGAQQSIHAVVCQYLSTKRDDFSYYGPLIVIGSLSIYIRGTRMAHFPADRRILLYTVYCCILLYTV